MLEYYSQITAARFHILSNSPFTNNIKIRCYSTALFSPDYIMSDDRYIQVRSILYPTVYIYVDLTSSPFSLRFTNQNFVCASNSSRECYMHLPFYSLSSDHLMILLGDSRYYGDPQQAYAVLHILLYFCLECTV